MLETVLLLHSLVQPLEWLQGSNTFLAFSRVDYVEELAQVYSIANRLSLAGSRGGLHCNLPCKLLESCCCLALNQSDFVEPALCGAPATGSERNDQLLSDEMFPCTDMLLLL